jgi:DNA gyrase subunit B
MPELIKGGRMFVAQPPLYQVTRRKKAEYVLNERAMRQTLITLGLEGSELIVRDPDDAKKPPIRTIGGDDPRQVIEKLERLEEMVKVVQRRGLDFADVLDHRSKHGTLPQFYVIVDGEPKFLSAGQRDDLIESGELEIQDAAPGAPTNGAAASNGNGDATTRSKLQKHVELHELKDGESLFAELAKWDLNIDDYYLTQEESVSGEKLATKYALTSESKTHDIAGVAQILPQVLQLGKQGIEVKRFKGLGEMNSEELWETTLDPNKRVLLRVTLQEAGEAERMFSVLMGEDVERRRQFIEDHALEVKNLDV